MLFDGYKHIVVTGVERSRTSLTMQILKEIGINVIGEKFPSITNINKKEKTARDKRVEDLNPKGFFEHIPVLRNGIVGDGDDVKNSAMKILATGIINTSLPVIKNCKIIFCMRKPINIASSARNLISQISIGKSENEMQYINSILPENPAVYLNRLIPFIKWLHSNKWLMDKILWLDTDTYYNDSILAIKKIFEYIGFDEEPKKYVGLIDGSLNRHTTEKTWPEDWKDLGALADSIYDGIINKNLDIALAKINDMEFEHRNRNVKWFDDTELMTYSIMTPSLFVDIQNNEKNRTFLQNQGKLKAKKRKIPIGNCKHYKISDSEYTIERSSGLSELTRKNIFCGKISNDVTREYCLRCWLSGVMINGEKYDPKKDT